MNLFKLFFKPNALTTGLAMFAMFFGSGNLIFPLSIGQSYSSQVYIAMMGLFITAVFMPFATLCLMMFYKGDYEALLLKIGKVPGRLVLFIILALIGPFGVLPRCIAFSYSTLSIYSSGFSLELFSFIACIIIFLFSVKTTKVVGLIGNILTPILLLSLIFIIFKGLISESSFLSVLSNNNFGFFNIFINGMVEGYKTFDIFAAIFFATAIMPSFSSILGEKNNCQKSILRLAIKSSLIGMFLLFAIYLGLGLVSAKLSNKLIDIPTDKLLGTIAHLIMGKEAGLLANIVVLFACLTTAITLAVVSADFFMREVFLYKINYFYSLIITMIITFIFSCLGFDGIMRMVLPVLIVLCPAIIALIISSALEKFINFKYTKQTFYLVLSLSFIFNFLI